MKTILYVQPNSKVGGSFHSLYYLLERIDKTKYNPIVLFPSKNNILIKKLEDIGVKCIVSPFPSVPCSINTKHRLLVTDFMRFFALKKFYIRRIPSLSPDLVHLNSLNSVFGFYMAKKLCVPVIWHVREQFPAILSNLIRGYFLTLFKDMTVKHIICISENECKNLPTRNKLHVIHNFYRLDKQPIDIHKPIKFITIGNFTTDKGFWLLIDSVKKLSIKYSPEDLKIFLMGISPRKTVAKRILREKSEADFIQEIKKKRIQEYFEILPQSIQISPSFFSNFHVLIRPSLYQDPWGRDIIEAMSTGRAVIATGNYSKFVRDGFNGYLVDSSDPFALAKKMEDFLLNRKSILEFSNNSFLLAKKLFDPSKNTAQIEKIYESTLT
jgi:glycosyltransferase involved in cell wall biosynthesis